MIYNTTNDIVLDIHQKNIQSIFTKQYDNETRHLHITVCDSNVPINLSEYIVKIKGKTPKGRILFKDCKNNDDGTIDVTLDQNMLFDKGNTFCEILILDPFTEEILSTMPFIIHVKSTVFTDDDVSEEEYSFLNEIIKREEELFKNFDKIVDDVNDIDTYVRDLIGGFDSGDLGVLKKIANHTFEGRDLTQIYIEEISEFDNPWEWLQNRINNNNFDSIYMNDYIPFELDETYNAHILGIFDTYKDGEVYHNVDFMTSESYIVSAQWNRFGVAMYDGEYATKSSISSVLNNDIFPNLPEEMQDVIKDKEIDVPIRSAEGIVDNGVALTNLGKLWLLYEPEIFGRSSLGTNTYDTGFTQYPLFRLYPMSKIITNNSEQVEWWTYSGVENEMTKVVTVNNIGVPQATEVSEEMYFPLCFRMTSDEISDEEQSEDSTP